MPIQSKSRDQESLRRWIPVCLLAFFFWMQTFVMGIEFNDNTNYLWASTLDLHHAFVSNHYWSPFYIQYLRLLSHICPDIVARYFFGWGLCVVALALVPLLFRLRHAWIYSVVMISFPLLTIDPFVSLMAAPLLVAGLCLVAHRRWPILQTLFLFAALAFFVSFIRPEYDYALLIAAFSSVVALALQALRPNLAALISAKPIRRAALFTVGTVAIACATVYVIHHATNPRSGVAFAQHYNRRAVERHALVSAAPWQDMYVLQQFHIDLTHNATTTTANVADFLRANPRLFFLEVLRNAVDFRTLELILPWLVLIALPWFFPAFEHLRTTSIFLALIGLPVMISMLVVYPRSHYAILLFPAVLLYATQLLPAGRWLQAPLWTLPAGCALIWFCYLGWPLHNDSAVPSRDRLYLLRTECIRPLDRSTTYRGPAFDAVGIKSIYFAFDHDMQGTNTLSTWPQFQAWARTAQPEWISATSDTAHTYGVTPDAFDDFVRGELHFTPHVCPAASNLTIYTNDTPAAQ